jgi:6-pyruvoyltetrahydropterin/6-carboxytetrahydropterin synthase
MPRVLTAAAGRFEAARRLDLLPPGHRSRRLHGHGFRACAQAALADERMASPGDALDELRRRMAEAVAPLDYQDLNAILDQPSDENIARWLQARLALAGIERLAVQSTADHGVDLDRGGGAQVWRRYRFQAAHRLPHVPAGHKCGRMHGHGFEVVVHARQDAGARAPGIDYDRLDALWAPLQAELDYRCLNDLPGLSNPTSEIIAAWLWARLRPALPELSWVTVYETASCGASFDGARYRIWKDFGLDSAVRIARAPDGSRLRAVHGHSFTLRLHLGAPLDQVMGWTIDFGDVKALFDPLFRELDHRPLYELPGLADADTHSLARWIHAHGREPLPQLVRTDLYETEGCGALVSEDVEVPALP